MRAHRPCRETQCHLTDHCDACAQHWPCDAFLLKESHDAFVTRLMAVATARPPRRGFLGLVWGRRGT